MTERPGPGPSRPSGGRADGTGRPGRKGAPARRPGRGGAMPPPSRGGSPKTAGPKSTGAKPPASKTPASKTPASKPPGSTTTGGARTGAPKAGSAKAGGSKGGAAKGTASRTGAPGTAGPKGAAPKTARTGSGGRKAAAQASPAGPGRGRSAGRAARAPRDQEPGGPRGPRGPRGGPPGGRRPAIGRPRLPFHRRDPLKRLNIGLLVVAFVLSLFAGRLVQLQTIESGKYTAEAMQQRLQEIELPAVRGRITDAEGNALAVTVEARAITADPYVIKPEKRQAIAAALAPALGLDPAHVLKVISKPKTRFAVLAHGVRPDQARLITSWGFPGIGTLPEYRREYPNNSLGAGVIGFVNGQGRGAAGLEHSMEGVLAGRKGSQRVEISLDGQHIPMGEDQKHPPVPGTGVRLTLMRDLQFAAQQAIEKQVKATGARSGTAIVMDPRTGRLLAMASAPGYDPNRYADARGRWGSPLVQDSYEPGSTGKVITAAAVIEKGVVTPDTPFTVPYSVRRADRVFHDSHVHRTENLTFTGVLAKSSNVGTILASERISGQQLYQTLRDFGIGQKTGLPLPGETAGLLRPPDQWSGTDRYPIAFGQTVSVNAVQMASVYATIANGGVRVAPTLVAGTVGENDRFTPAPEPARRQVISAATARQLSAMLEGVTTADGTAPKAQIPGYRVAGKTGTAEMVNPSCGCYKDGGYTASFAGFAPADDPRLVVQVVVQDPRGGNHYGGEVAAPVFRDVMGFALQTMKIPPTGSRPPVAKIYAGG